MIGKKYYYTRVAMLALLCFVLSSFFAEADMIGQWVFDKSYVNGSKIEAVVGNFDATVVGKTILNMEPSSLELDGSNYIAITEKGKSIDLPKKEISAEAWIRVNSYTDWGGIIGYFQDNGAFERGWILGYRSSHFGFALSSSEKLTYMGSPAVFELGEWYHVVGTYDGSIMSVYVNGKLESKSNEQSGDIAYVDSYFSIGAYKDDDEFFPLEGDIHEIRLYDSALSAKEILANYEAKKSIFPEKPKESELALGPYLQFTSPNSAIVRWWTNEPSPSVLLYREGKPDEYRIADDKLKRKHEAIINNLKPNAIYSYLMKVREGGEEMVTATYECDTFFNYSLPLVPRSETKFALYSDAAEHIIKETGITQGYCVIIGSEDGKLAYELARRSNLRIIGVDDDAKKVNQARKNLKKLGIYGSRATIQQVSSLSELPFTDIFANLIVSESMMSKGKCVSTAAEVNRLLCPEGVAYLGHPANSRKKISLEKLKEWIGENSSDYKIEDDNGAVWAKMVGKPISGSGRWSHQYGDANNSATSLETLQGAKSTSEMDVQWVGLPGPRAQADRNGRKPAPLALNGRLFIQGLHRIAALDAYNGAILWSLEVPPFERFNIPRDCSNWCADDDYVYTAIKNRCWRLDAQTGEVLKLYDLVAGKRNWAYDWGYIGRAGDRIYGSAVKSGSPFIEFWGGSGQGWYDATSGEATHKVCSDNLFALKEDSGKTVWVYQNGIIINSTITIGNGHVYFVECRNKQVIAEESRRVGSEELWKDQYLVSLDADSGKRIWEKPIDTADGIVMFHLAYGNDMLYLLSSAKGKYNLYAYDAATGEEKWDNAETWASDNHGGHMARPAIVGNTVFLRPYTFDATTGKKLEAVMPGGGCGTYAASTSAIIFRSGNVTMWDMSSKNVTSWHRLRPDCWLSTIPACGLLLSPEAGGGCSCGNWMETSIAFRPIINGTSETSDK